MALWSLLAFVVIGVFISVVITAIYCYYQRRRRALALIQYHAPDSYSDLASEVKFVDSKNTKIWIGQIGLNQHVAKQKNEFLQQQNETYAVALKVAKNWCKMSNFEKDKNERTRKIADELPCIGHRQLSKFYHPMYDEKYGSQRVTSKKRIRADNKRLLLYHYDTQQLPAVNTVAFQHHNDHHQNDNASSQMMGKCRVFNNYNDEQFRAFKLIFETLQHPYLMPTYEIHQSKDKRHIFMIRDLERTGSLRDHIHVCDLSKKYHEKYAVAPGKPLHLQKIRKYGRQILEALKYLHECGLVDYHLHSGNIIVQNDSAKLCEIENMFFGYQLRHPLHQHLQCIKRIYTDLDVEICLFGYVVFEMAAGIESPTASPLDCLHELPRKLDENVVRVLGRIFGDKSLGSTPCIDDLLRDPLFSATNVPAGDVSCFTALRNENEMVQQLQSMIVRQCHRTFSKAMLTSTTSANKKRKKKKKHKFASQDSQPRQRMEDDISLEHMGASSFPPSEELKEEYAATPKHKDAQDEKSDLDEERNSADDLWSSQ